MSTQGERKPEPAGPQAGPPVHGHHARAGSRRLALWCALVALAAGGGWIVARPNPGDLIPGLGRTSPQHRQAAPVAGAAQSQPLTETQSFTVDNYFPADNAVELGDFQAKRTAARQGGDCAETLQDRRHDVLHGLNCQAYVTVEFLRTDKQVATSVTVLRFADAGAAARAGQTLANDPGALAFLVPDASATPAPGQPVSAKPLTASRTRTAGHYLTVTTSRYADLRLTAATTDHALDDATRAVSYAAGLPFVWI